MNSLNLASQLQSSTLCWDGSTHDSGSRKVEFKDLKLADFTNVPLQEFCGSQTQTLVDFRIENSVNKFAGFMADAAPVNLGFVKIIAKELKDEYPWLLCHCLNLCWGLVKSTYLSEIFSSLKKAYDFYRKS